MKTTTSQKYSDLHPNINTKRHNITTPLSPKEFEKIMKDHASFLEGYTALGKWESLLISEDIIMALYHGEESDGQANFSRKSLSLDESKRPTKASPHKSLFPGV